MKIHIALVGSLIGHGGNELIMRLARHLTIGMKVKNPKVEKILKNSVLHLIFTPQSSELGINYSPF